MITTFFNLRIYISYIFFEKAYIFLRKCLIFTHLANSPIIYMFNVDPKDTTIYPLLIWKVFCNFFPVCSLSTLNRKLGFGYIPFVFCIRWTILCLIMKLKWSWYYSSTVQYYILKAILRLHFSCNLV